MSEYNRDRQYDTYADLLAAFSNVFQKVDGKPDDWKGLHFRTDEGGQTIRVSPYTGPTGRGKWRVELSTSWDFTTTGSGELTPHGLDGAVTAMRRQDELRRRVDQDAIVRDLTARAAEITQKQAALRTAALTAVTAHGMPKLTVAAAAGISRPTLDRWLADEDARWGKRDA